MGRGIDLKTGQTIVFIGDSITDAGRDLPDCSPFGYGYVHFAAYMLLARYPELNLNIINRGISGDTVEELRMRWESDCIFYQPDVVSVMIGINDLWRQCSEDAELCSQVSVEEYELTYRRLLSEVKNKCGSQIVLMEPFMFCGDGGNQILRNLAKYIEAVHRLAEEFDAVLVRLQSRIDKVLERAPAEKWSADTVHPYTWAHAWISQQWLKDTGLLKEF